MNLRFFRDGREVPHEHPELHLADSITITFFFHKNDERDATITQRRAFDPELCPVRIWAAIVKRILSYPGTGPKTTVNTYMEDGKLKEVTSKMILDRLRAVARHIGEDELGFKAKEIGTHSL